MAEATKHLPAHRPTKEAEMPQGRKNWDKPPQQVDGPEGPEPLPHPQDVSGANRRLSKAKKPQQVDGPDGPDGPEPPEPSGNTKDEDVPQQVDGPDGPSPTDGTELTESAASAALPTPPPPPGADDDAPHKSAPAKKTAATKGSSTKDGDK
jgi:hypothetical protein